MKSRMLFFRSTSACALDVTPEDGGVTIIGFQNEEFGSLYYFYTKADRSLFLSDMLLVEEPGFWVYETECSIGEVYLDSLWEGSLNPATKDDLVQEWKWA